MEHGYIAYTHGCRCEVCRKAKADYMRERRAAARALAQKYTQTADGTPGNPWNAFANGSVRFLAPIKTHGTRAGYEEHGCRCRECTSARTRSDQRYARSRSARRYEPQVDTHRR